MMEEFLKELRTKVWRTAGARYDAARRLKRREIVSTISLAFFSALTVVLAFVQRVYAQQAGTAFDNYLTALSVCLGIFLLAISLIEWGAGAGSKAEALHRNAEDLTALQILIWQRISEVESGKVGKWSDIDDLRTEYERIKERCTANHDPLDDRTFLAHNRMAPEFLDKDRNPKIGSMESYWITSRYFITSLWYFAVFWLLLVLALWNIPWPGYK